MEPWRDYLLRNYVSSIGVYCWIVAAGVISFGCRCKLVMLVYDLLGRLCHRRLCFLCGIGEVLGSSLDFFMGLSLVFSLVKWGMNESWTIVNWCGGRSILYAQSTTT